MPIKSPSGDRSVTGDFVYTGRHCGRDPDGVFGHGIDVILTPVGILAKQTSFRRAGRSRDGCGKWGGIDVASCPVRSNRSRSKTQMVFVYVVFATGVLLQFFIGSTEHPGPRIRERSRVELRVLDHSLDMKMIDVRPCPAFNHVQGVAVWVGVFVYPHSLILEPNRVDYQRVPFPSAQSLAEERRIRVV